MELGIHFHDHVVLIHRPVDGGDLPLAEGVVERVVDRCSGSDAQAAGRIAIDDQPACSPWFCKSLFTSRSLGKRLEALDHAGRISQQILQVVSLKRVLELRSCRRPPICTSCTGLQEKRGAWNARQLADADG